MKKAICFAIILSLFLSLISCYAPVENDLVLYKNSGIPLKIAHFSDLHFGTEGKSYHNADEARTVAFMDYVVETQKPDLIVLGGDNIMSTGVEGAKKLVALMDKYRTPYIFVFGNHDAELFGEGLSKSYVSSYLESCGSPYLLYKSGYTDSSSENRYGNYSVLLKDVASDRLLGAFLIIDTGVYDYSKGVYQEITDGQTDWYRGEIERLNVIFKKHGGNGVIPSIVYGHIQLPQHFEAYKSAVNGNAKFVYHQDIKISDRMAASEGGNSGDFFTEMKHLGSSKGYICGHMHGLTFHVRTDGITLGFCPQSGVPSKNASKRSTFVYTLNDSFELIPTLITEQ
ncbi:MAG: metallophosphoesterase [Clostridia bacterium]|nr:metallophosphoesterase [Clostridia bacterium]